MKKLSNLLKIVVPIFISIIFIYLILKNIDLNQFIDTLSKTNYLWVVVTVIIVIVSFGLRGVRLKYICRNLKTDIKFKSTIPITYIGFMANNVLPFRLGEVIRIYLLKKDEGIEFMSGAGAIVVERLLDTLMLLIFFISYTVFFTVDKNLLVSGYLATALFVIGCFTLFLIINYTKAFMRILNIFLKFLPQKIKIKIEELIISFTKGFAFYKYPKDLLNVVIHTVLVWITSAIYTYTSIISIPNLEIPFTFVFLLIPILGVSVIIPSAPSYAGTYHWACIWAITSFFHNISKDSAIVFAILYHLIQVIPVTLIGLFFWFKESLSFKTITKVKEDIQEEELKEIEKLS